MSPELRRGLLRLGLAGGLVLLMATFAGETLVRATLPLLQKSFAVAAPDFRVLEFGIVEVQGERRLAIATTLSRVTIVGARVLLPNPLGRAEAVTPMAHVLQGPLVVLLAAAAWPARSRREFGGRIAVALPLAAALMLIDAPWVLAASLWQILLDALAPQQASPLVAWSSFLRGGGRYALAVAAAAIAVALCVPQKTPPAGPLLIQQHGPASDPPSQRRLRRASGSRRD